MATLETIGVTGATGQLGRLFIAEMARRVPSARLVALVRNPAAAQDLAAQGVAVRQADYDDPATLTKALANVDKLLLISSNALGHRVRQHRNVVDAAKAVAVNLIAYTSVLRADTSPLGVAIEHRETEAAIRGSGLPFVFLRNGWYTENYTGNIGAALQHGAVLGSARDGKISAAARADYAAAAAAVFASADSQAGKIYELAGDSAFTLAAYAAEIARQSGKPVIYQDLPAAQYQTMLQSIGLPAALAELIADSDAKAADGALFDAGGQLSRLIGRPTTTLAQSVTAALATAG